MIKNISVLVMENFDYYVQFCKKPQYILSFNGNISRTYYNFINELKIYDAVAV